MFHHFIGDQDSYLLMIFSKYYIYLLPQGQQSSAHCDLEVWCCDASEIL